MNQLKQDEGGCPIRIRNLEKRNSRDFALGSIDLDINKGEFLTLLGPSGSGKTTLLMAIAGLIHPDAGSIQFGNREVILTPPHKRGVGVVFQNYALFPHMNVAENIAFSLRLRSVGQNERRERVEEALEKVRLSGFGPRRISELSGGQRQRVALARAFVFGPRVLLMDEPLSALDKTLREQMQLELKALQRDLGITTLYVTHDQREALIMSDRIAVLNAGKVEQIGTPEEVYNHPINAFVADFLGDTTAIPLARNIDGELMLYDQKVLGVDDDVQREWLLVVRNERLFLTSGPRASDSSVLFLSGIVKTRVFQGDSKRLIVELDSRTHVSVPVEMRSDGTITEPQVGQKISLGLRRSDAIIVPNDGRSK